jgi:hypothetical protein
VLVRSVFYGAAAGALTALLVFSYELFRASPSDLLAMVPGIAVWGAGFGAGTGLALGILIFAFKVRHPVNSWLRLTIALLASLVVFVLIAVVFRTWPLGWPVSILLLPPALATWFLLPLVLRPEVRDPMPTLGPQAN